MKISTRLIRLRREESYRRRFLHTLGLFRRYPTAIWYKAYAKALNRTLHVGLRVSNQRRVACNVCGWSGNAFDTLATFGYVRRNAICPNCGSLERHRAMVALLTERGFLVPGARCLDVGGIPSFRPLFESARTHYTSISLGDPAMACMNVESLAFPPACFDLILDSHVLEYVNDVRTALSELARVLRRGGTLWLTEAYRFGSPHTLEFGKPNPEATFMVRQFGDDLMELLTEAGLRFTRFDYTGRNDARGDYFFVCQK